MTITEPISIERCCRAIRSRIDAELVDCIISIQRGWRARPQTATPQAGFLATEFTAPEVECLYEEGGTFFLLRRKGAVLGFALTTGIDRFTEQFRSDSGGRLITPKPLNLDEYVYLYQVAIRKGEEQRGLGGGLGTACSELPYTAFACRCLDRTCTESGLPFLF